MCETEREFSSAQTLSNRSNFTPLYFCVLVRLRIRKVSNLNAFKAVALRFENCLVERLIKTQKYKGVIFEQFESVWAYENYVQLHTSV